MTKAISPPTDRGQERPATPGGGGEIVRCVSLEEAFDGAEGIAISTLPGFILQGGDGRNLEWFRREVLLPLGVEFLDRRVVRSDYLETWASAVALLRWAEEFNGAVRPWVGAYLERKFPGVPGVLAELLDVVRPDSFLNRIGVWIEEAEFRAPPAPTHSRLMLVAMKGRLAAE